MLPLKYYIILTACFCIGFLYSEWVLHLLFSWNWDPIGEEISDAIFLGVITTVGWLWYYKFYLKKKG